jgi:glutaredoxin-like YruB-family protein
MANVKVYSTPTCPWCKKAKDFLTEKGVEFEDLDVSSNEEARKEMMDKTGQMGVPVLDVNGKIIVGFNQDEIIAALKEE